jgi:hypothetical protein
VTTGFPPNVTTDELLDLHEHTRRVCDKATTAHQSTVAQFLSKCFGAIEDAAHHTALAEVRRRREDERQREWELREKRNEEGGTPYRGSQPG